MIEETYNPILLAKGKVILNQITKQQYIVSIIDTTEHECTLHGIMTIRQTGESGLKPNRHECRIYLKKPDDKTVEEITSHRFNWQRFTPPVIFLASDAIKAIAWDLIREYNATLNQD